MFSARYLGHHPAVFLMKGDLRRYDIAENGGTIHNDSGGCFITGAFNTENGH
jgi:hypothetical protein